MSSIAANFITSDDGTSFVTVIHEGSLLSARDDHPNYQRIVSSLASGEPAEAIARLFDPAEAAAEMFEALSRRVSVSNGRVYFDGDEIDNALTKQVVRFLGEGHDDKAISLVWFFEKVQANPNEHSREQLFEWLDKHEFTITFDGDIVGYKGVDATEDDNGGMVYHSISRGTAIVDGVAVEGRVPNAIGSVVEMPRSSVQHDPSHGCSTGLHVGTWDYADSFARGAVLEVHVNPTDVVSVPTECEWQKMRTCRYEVVNVVEAPYNAPVIDMDGAYEDEEVSGDYDDEGLGDRVADAGLSFPTPSIVQPSQLEWDLILQEAKDRKKGVPIIAKKHGFVMTDEGARKQRPNAVRDRLNWRVA